MRPKSIIRQAEKALGFTLGLAWIGWHALRYGAREALEAQHACSALRGMLERLRGEP